MRFWVLVIVLMFMTGCGEAGRDAAPDAPRSAPASTDCPAPPELEDPKVSIFWPGDKARDLVPALKEVCAIPTSPHLFTLLYESASWTNEFRAGALGLLSWKDEPLATFSVVRVAAGTPGLDKIAGGSGTVTTQMGDVTISWGRAGDHVAAYWVDDLDLVTLTGGAEGVVTALERWFGSVDAAAPDSIPSLSEMPPALDAGPPVDGLPDGYEVFVMDALAFMGSDFADAVTIFEEKGIEALGAGVVVSDEDEVLGTIVAGRGHGSGLGLWPGQVEGLASGALGDVAAAGFTASGVDVLVVGYDRDAVTAFTSAWESSVSK